jgi:hypothetical protein
LVTAAYNLSATSKSIPSRDCDADLSTRLMEGHAERLWIGQQPAGIADAAMQ